MTPATPTYYSIRPDPAPYKPVAPTQAPYSGPSYGLGTAAYAGALAFPALYAYLARHRRAAPVSRVQQALFMNVLVKLLSLWRIRFLFRQEGSAGNPIYIPDHGYNLRRGIRGRPYQF